jgi:hypothetical protein
VDLTRVAEVASTRLNALLAYAVKAATRRGKP